MRIEKQTPWYAELNFESLKDFFEWKISQNIISFDKFVFRGLPRNSYRLVPSALRCDEHTQVPRILNYHPSEIGANMASLTLGNIVESEFNLLSKFFKEANKQGLFVPNIKNFSNNYLARYHNEYFDKLSVWYDNDMCEIAALAQHYGIPTRMLDWTFNINIALYFALEGVIGDLYKKEDIEDTYVVWGVSAENILANYDDFNDKYHCPIKFYVPNYIGNEHIKQQKGLLAYKVIADYQNERLSHYIEEPFDKVLLDYYKKINNTYIRIENDGIQLFKMTFPTKLAVSEFEMLSKDGYNAASVFSGYDGIVKKLQEDEWISTLRRLHHN